MSLQISSCLSYSFVIYPSPKLIFKATLISRMNLILYGLYKQIFIACFLSKAYLVQEVTNSLTFYLWALVCGFLKLSKIN